MMVNKTMRGRIQCPQCGNEFIAQAPKDAECASVHCPACDYSFTVKTTNDMMTKTDQDSAECSWEEHGEPRKTILSSMKPRTDKPMLAAILLIAVVIIGISSAVFPQAFVETPIGLLSLAGVKEDVHLLIQDPTDQPLENVTISLSDSLTSSTNETGKTTLSNLALGTQTLLLSKNNSTASITVSVAPFDSSIHTIRFNTATSSATITNPQDDLTWISILLILFSLIALLSAISSIRRRHSDVALMGSILGIFTIGFFLIGSFLSVIAFILIFKSKEEFDDGKKGKSF